MELHSQILANSWNLNQYMFHMYEVFRKKILKISFPEWRSPTAVLINVNSLTCCGTTGEYSVPKFHLAY